MRPVQLACLTGADNITNPVDRLIEFGSDQLGEPGWETVAVDCACKSRSLRSAPVVMVRCKRHLDSRVA